MKFSAQQYPIKAIRYLIFALASSMLCPALAEQSSNWKAPDSTVQDNPIPYTVESVTEGKKLFNENCTTCHGYWGEGNGIIGSALENRPANLLRLAGTQQSAGQFAWKIAEGRGEMPSFKDILTEEQTWHTVNFIASLENEEGSSSESIVVRRCASCHSMAGVAFIEGWPDLPEMTQQEIENKLFGHRAQLISDSTMSKVAADLTDEEIKEAAKYYSELNKQNRSSE